MVSSSDMIIISRLISQLDILMLTYNPVRVLSPESIPDLSVVHHILTVSVHHSRGEPGTPVVSEPQIYVGVRQGGSVCVLPGEQGWRARQGLGRVEVRQAGGFNW